MHPTARAFAVGRCAGAGGGAFRAGRVRDLVVLVAAVLTLAGCTAPSSAEPAPLSTEAPAGLPTLDVEVVTGGLSHPWDVVQAPDGTLLVDEREGGFTAVLADGTVRTPRAGLDDLFARGETGLMGLALDPAFGENRRFYSCQGSVAGEIRVVGWTVAPDWSSATRTADPLVGGLPLNDRTGRHGGCRLEFAPDGALLVGTGDTAEGTASQDPASLGGKVLRVDPATGAVTVWTRGHRNVQGLAWDGEGRLWASEFGPDVDDELNLLEAGGDYGWDPDGAGAYDESVPMTDPAVPGAVEAVWSSGQPTLATSGATFVTGDAWGAYDGLLLVALLKAQGVLALRLDEEGTVLEQFGFAELEGTHGRIRTVRQGLDGALYAVTDNGTDDVLLRITPRG